MANSANFEASLKIKAGVDGTDAIDKLAESISEAGIDVTHLTDESAKLAKQFGEIENKQALINQFRELKKATGEANAEWQQAQQATASYTAQIDTAKDSLEALAIALQNQGDMSKEETKATQAEYNAMVREIKNLENAQTEQATKASQLKTQYEDLNASLVDTRSAMHDVGLSTTGLNDQQKALTEESRIAQESLAQLTAEAQNLNEIAQAKILLGIDTDDKALAQIEEITRAYETLRDSGVLTEEELERATQAHTERVAELEASLAETAPTLEDIAGEFGKVTAAAGGLAYVTNAAMRFETAMVGVKKVVDGTPEQINQLSKEIQDMSVQLGMGSDAVAEIAANGGQLGIPIEKLGEFTKMAGQMAIAFNMSAEEAGNAAAKLANVFDIPIAQVGELGDAINTLGNTTAAKESEIVDTMLRIGGTAKQFGLAEEQAAALSAAFISLGKSPEVAGTAINGLLTKLMTANVQGDDFKNTLTNMGISAERLASDIHEHPQAALTGFLSTLQEMDSQQRSVATFKLFGQEYSDDVNVLVGALGSYNSALDTVKDKSNTAGAMQKEFTANMNSSEQSIAQAKQSINVLAETVGKELLPVVAMAAKGASGLATGIKEFADAHPYLVQLGVLLASGQLAMVAFGSAMNLAGMLGVRSTASITAGMTTTAGATSLATTASDRLTTSLGLMGTAAQSTLIRLQAFRTAGIAGSLSALAGQMMSLNGLFAAAGGWTIGTAIGDSLYKNSELARGFGDSLARIPAMIASIVNTGGLEDYNKNYQTSAESARQAADAEKKHADSIQGKTEAIIKANEEAQKQKQEQQKVNEATKEAEANIKSLTAQMTVMKDNGQENTAEYKKLASQLEENKQKTDTLANSQKQASDNSKEQAASNQQLANSIKVTEANLEGMKNRLAEMEVGGQKNSIAYNQLSADIGKTTDKLELLQAEANKKGIGELLKSDLDKASEAFQALGLDAEEFATGIDSKTNLALSAFVDIAHLAEGDTRKLALAYNAAKEAAGDNQQAQAELDAKLAQVTEGNKQLANSVKATALEQKNAKSATDEQAAALEKLGISMTAVNNGMSKGGAEMVATLRLGITAIKEQATSADALKTSLQQAFSQSIGAAQTKADFAEIKQAIEAAGVASQLTTEQTKLLNAGMAGGAESAKAAQEAINAQTKALAENAAANEKTAESGKQVAQANQEIGNSAINAANKSTQSANEVGQAASGMTDMIAGMMDNFNASIANSLQSVGITAEQTTAIFAQAMDDLRFQQPLSFDQFFTDFDKIRQATEANIQSFIQARESALSMTQALGSTEVSANSLADAEQALYHATQANVDGIVRMDAQTLSNLQNAIDSARAKMEDLANQAQSTADNLEASLAKMKGDDSTALRLEQTRKLADLQEKLNEANERGNSKEIEQLQRAIELQKQINAEETRQTEIKKQQEQQRQQAEQQKKTEQQQAKNTPVPTPTSTPSNSPISTPSTPTNANDGNIIASAKLVASEIAKIKQDAINEFMKVLQDEIRRQAR